MSFTIINAQLGRSKKVLKKILPQKISKEEIKQTALKKIIPTTMIVAESLTPLISHAEEANKVLKFGVNYWDTEKFVHFIPKTFKPKQERLLPPLGNYDFVPKNNFSKNSEFLRKPYSGTIEELEYFIEDLIPKRKGKKDYNPFYKKAESFVEIGKKYNVNPTVLIAIGMQESGRGTSYAALKKNNIGGITLKTGLAKFNTVEDCIEKMAEIIDKRLKENYNSIEKIGKSGKYCAKSSADEWIRNVVFYLNNM